jgi:hypothetical protein
MQQACVRFLLVYIEISISWYLSTLENYHSVLIKFFKTGKNR